jgi:hypothetical protein
MGHDDSGPALTGSLCVINDRAATDAITDPLLRVQGFSELAERDEAAQDCNEGEKEHSG